MSSVIRLNDPEDKSAKARAFRKQFADNLNAALDRPLRQNSCRPDKMMNLGATRKRNGKVRRSIQETRGGEVIAAGER